MKDTKETLYASEFALMDEFQFAAEIKRAISAVERHTGNFYPSKNKRDLVRYEVARHMISRERPVRVLGGIFSNDETKKIREWIDVEHERETPYQAIKTILAPLGDPRKRFGLYKNDQERLFEEIGRLFRRKK